MKLSSLRTSLHFRNALDFLEPQIYAVTEQFVAENIPLLSRRLISYLSLHFEFFYVFSPVIADGL